MAVNQPEKKAPRPAPICQVEMELAKVPNRIFLVDPVRPFALLAKAALEVMTNLCEEAIVCLMEF